MHIREGILYAVGNSNELQIAFTKYVVSSIIEIF